MRQHRLGALEADQHGQAVRRRLGDIVRRQHAVGAGLVLDDDGRAACSLTFCANTRDRMSAMPPAWVGTMMRIGWSGKLWPRAGESASRMALAARRTGAARSVRMMFLRGPTGRSGQCAGPRDARPASQSAIRTIPPQPCMHPSPDVRRTRPHRPRPSGNNVTKPELGTKRLCAGCNAKFYDLLKSPIVCPMCEAVFVVPKPAPSRPRRGFEPIARVVPVIVAAPEIAERRRTTTRRPPAKPPTARRKPRAASRCWRSTRIDRSVAA